MVKGISRRVIVVRSPDQRLFEQAIFLMKEDALEQDGVTAQQVVDEAMAVADSYLRQHSPRQRRFRLLRQHKGWLWFLAGAVCACAVTVLVLGI
jgi:hypothetical protein